MDWRSDPITLVLEDAVAEYFDPANLSSTLPWIQHRPLHPMFVIDGNLVASNMWIASIQSPGHPVMEAVWKLDLDLESIA